MEANSPAPNALMFHGPKQIIPKINTNSCLDIKEESRNIGAQTIIFRNNKSLNQKFLIEKVGFNEYIIRALHSNLVLGVDGGNLRCSETDLRYVIQQKQNNTNSQLWAFEDIGNGYYYIRNCLGYYLDVEGEKTGDCTNLIIFPFHGNSNQQFKIV